MHELVEIRDVQPTSLAPHQSLRAQPPEHERDRFARRPNELAEEPAGDRRDGRAGAHVMTLSEPHERCDQPLFDGKHGVLTELDEERRPLGHDLSQQYQGSGGLLSQHGAESRRAQMQRLALLLRARLARVDCGTLQPLAAERLTRRRHPRHEAPPRAHLVAQHHLPAEHHEKSRQPPSPARRS